MLIIHPKTISRNLYKHHKYDYKQRNYKQHNTVQISKADGACPKCLISSASSSHRIALWMENSAFSSPVSRAQKCKAECSLSAELHHNHSGVCENALCITVKILPCRSLEIEIVGPIVESHDIARVIFMRAFVVDF